MQVILLERIERLGTIGDEVTVKTGFARNYLLPQKKALRANEANRKLFVAQRAQIEADNAKRRTAAEQDAKALEGKTVVLIRQASELGQLYGSVSSRDVADALSEGAVKVSKTQVVLDKPIKTLGLHKVRLVLHPEVTLVIEANVARSAEEAELQAKGVTLADMQAAEDAEAQAEAQAQAEADAGPAEDATEDAAA
ncbi:50S ribosomal protein L9 [Hankyongella ginsenosidimutans]|uniref:Large ribosomal subunit protein bL9 n=1 Tax=Hankyongella ginsenosidimutans TaxID=1763828 RepID=A0A4D7CC14_9SPHN|nr:50S ribosomal protein L9 [Hankyongella ginsenosidimutans]QCI79522.1 50S ribosomal protein L9 [Hankyongella ginsenosidimutans]TXG81215.1 MAG: 50S ribosomal protein L9 [Sphingomonadales bacterium]